MRKSILLVLDFGSLCAGPPIIFLSYLLKYVSPVLFGWAVSQSFFNISLGIGVALTLVLSIRVCILGR